MVGALLSLSAPPEPDHAADALAVAICHANGAPLQGGARVIASVSGTVIGRGPGEMMIEAAGVGYRLSVSAETLRGAPGVGEPGTLHSHLVLRDDGMQLFGFATESERELFLMLIGVQSVGPKVALAVLSGGRPRELLRTRSPPAMRPASRPCPASASAPPSGSSSS